MTGVTFQKGRMAQQESDNLLLAEISLGNRKALAKLHDRYAQALHAYLVTILRDPDLALDLLQELFMNFILKQNLPAETKNTKAYLFACARNLAMTSKRREENQQRLLPKLGLEFETANADLPAFDDEEKTLLQKAFFRLEASQREIIQLHLWENLSFRDLEDLLGRPKSNLNREFTQALNDLKKYMAPSTRRESSNE